MQRQPADLLSAETTELLRSCQTIIDEERLQRLLGRGFLLSQAVERWQTRAIWIVSRADADYPRRLKLRLKEDAPAVLYGCGDLNILKTGGLAVVGSRHVGEDLIDYAVDIGHLSAKAGKTLVSGGAKGIDQAAMRGALEAGGKASGVLADSLEKIAMNREHRNLLMDEQLVLLSPYDPSAGFNVGHAMQRNKLIYALADAALVVNSDFNKGGTWAGAIEQLDKLRWGPVYVRSTGEAGEGLRALRQKGALPWPNPQDPDTFSALFDVVLPNKSEAIAQAGFTPLDQQSTLLKSFNTQRLEPENKAAEPTPSALQPALNPADILFATVRELLRNMKTLKTDAEVAADLNVSKSQMREWLQRLVEEGLLEKHRKPPRYGVKVQRFLLK
jgi:DNA processing protein